MVFYWYGVIIALMLYILKWDEVKLLSSNMQIIIMTVLAASLLSWFVVITFIIDIINELKN